MKRILLFGLGIGLLLGLGWSYWTVWRFPLDVRQNARALGVSREDMDAWMRAMRAAEVRRSLTPSEWAEAEQLTRHQDHKVRLMGYEVFDVILLGSQADAAKSVIMNMADDRDPAVREAAVSSFVKGRLPGWTEMLAGLSASEDQGDRERAELLMRTYGR